MSQPSDRSEAVKPGVTVNREKPGIGTQASRALGYSKQGDEVTQTLNNNQSGQRDTNHSVAGTVHGTAHNDTIYQNFGGDGIGPASGDRPNTALMAVGNVKAGAGDDTVNVDSGTNVTGQDISRLSNIDLGSGNDTLNIKPNGVAGDVYYNGTS